eukprot:snap_masked-scaffold_3-processed-gene-16.25-mRNA-1 protein AED:1.00 eAED:1.00 QI:0/0/0/0/1/1/2/0/90
MATLHQYFKLKKYRWMQQQSKLEQDSDFELSFHEIPLISDYLPYSTGYFCKKFDLNQLESYFFLLSLYFIYFLFPVSRQGLLSQHSYFKD